MAGPDLSPAKDVVAPPTETPRRGADAGEAQVDSPPSASRAGLSVHSKAKRRSRRDAPSSAGGSGSRRSRDSKAAAALASSSSSSLLADADANAAGDAAGAAPANGSAKDGEERRSRSRSGSKNRKHGKRSSSSSKRGERHSRRHRHHSHHHRHSRSRPTSARGERKSRRSRSKRASTRPSTPAAPLTPAASSSSHRLSSDGRRRGRSHDDLSREAAGGPASPSSVAEVSSRADSVHSPSPQPDKPQAEAEAPSTPDEPKRRRRHRSHSGGRRRHRSGSGSRRHHDRRHRHHRSRPSSRSLSRPKRAASTRNLRAEPKSNDARKDSDSKPKSGRRSRSREPHRRKRRSRSLSRKHYSREEDGAISSPHQPTRRTPREGGEADAADSGSSSDSSSSGSSSDSSDSGSDSSDSDSHSYTGSESWSSDSDSSDDDYSSNGRRSAGRTPRPHVRDRRSRSRQADDEYSSMYRNPERRRHRGRKVAAPPSIQTRMAEQRQQQQQELRDQRAAQAEADVRYYATPDASPSHRRSDRSERRGRAASPKSARYHSHKGKRKHHSTGRVRKSMARRGSRDDMHVTASRSRARSAARDRDRAALTRSSSRSMSALPGVIKHGPGSNTSMASGSSHASRGSRASRASRSVPPDSGIPPPPPPRTRQRPRPQSSAAGTSAARAKQRELARAQTTRATLDRQSSGVRRSQTDLQLHHSQSVDAKQERRLVRSHSRPIALANAKQLDMSIASLTSSDDEDASPGKKRRVRINSKPDLNVSSSFDLAEFDDNDDDDIDNSASSLTLAKVNGSSPMVHSRTVPTAMVSRGRRGTAAMRALLETKHGVKPSDTLLADVVYCISDLLRWRPARGNWADPDGKTCAKCQVTFTFTRRKYHCKYCGDLFCSSCSSHTRSFSMLGFVKKPLRVCDLCFRRPPPELEPFHDWEQELTTAQTQVKSLRLELRAQRKRDVKMAKLKAQRSALKTRVQSLMAERADWANLRDELLATEEKRDELMHALEVQLQRNQEMAHVLESEKRQNQQNEAALMADLDAAEAAVEAQQAQIEELTARLYEHEDNNHSQHLHRRHDELAAMHSQLQEDFDAETAQLRIEAEAEKRRANELAMLLDVKSAEAKRLQRQLAAYAGDAANNGQGNSDEDSEDPNSSRKVARAQLRQIHDEHAHELDAAKQEQNKLHGVVAELEEEICELNNSTSTLRDKCEMLRETVREDKGTINALKKELAMAKAQSRVRENRVRSGDSDSDLRVQLANKEDELTEALTEQELLLRREAELASELEAALADLRRSADASEQLKQCVADLEDVTAERDAFKRMHEEANAQAGDYMQSLIQCQLELNSVVNQKRELEAALKTAGGNAESARIRELTIELNAKARELLTKEREKVETEARAQQVEERLREQEEEHARILDELQHVEAAMHLAEGVVEKAQKHMENKSMEMRQNSASHETVQAEYEAALAETDELRVQLLEAELIITKTQKERDEMHRRYAEARDKLQLCVADLEEARREARKHEEAVQSLSQQNADLMNNLVASQAESTSLRGQVEGKDDTLETALEEAEAELQEAQTELREAHENVESLTTELHEAQEERDRAQQHATELEDQIGALLGSSADSAAQLEALETQYAAAESDKEQLQKELHAIQEAHKGDSETMEKRSEELDLVLHAALQTPNEGGEAAARAAQEAHAEHLAVIELKERVERKSSIITTLSHQLQDAETEKTELTAQVEQLQTERDDLRVRVEKAGEEQEQLASTIAALNLRIEEGSTEKTELTAQVEQLQTERDDLRVRVEEATTEQERQASTIAALTRRVEEANVEQTELTVQLQTERDDLRVRVDEANTEKTELTAQVEQLQTERDDLRGRVKKATSEQEQQASTIAALSVQVKEASTEKTELTAQVEQLQSARDDLRARIEEATTEQERQASAIAALSVQVKEANTEKTELTVQTVELQNERDRLVRRNKELAKKLEQLNEEHANLLSRVEQREEQLEKMAASMTSLTEERQERDAEHEKELADMHERMQHLSHRAELGSRAEELEDELATVSLERMKLSQEVERLMECNATMTNEMTENQSLIETLSQQLESEVQQRSELTIEYEVQLAELKSRMQEAKHARPGANERDLQAQVAALEDETSQLKHQLDMAVTRNMAHDRRASEQMAATNKALADRIQSLKSHVADYTTLLDERSDELEGMHADMLKRLNDMAAEIQALEATVMTLNKQCENLKQQLAKTKGVSKKLKQQLAAALGELEGAQQQLVRRQADFHAQTKQLEASRDRMRERQAVMADTMSGLVNQLEAMEDRCATLSAELEQATAEREQYASQVGMGTDTIADKVLRSQAEERLRPKKFRTRSTQTQMVLIAKKPVVRPSPPKKGTSSKKGSLKKRRSYIKKPRPRRSKSTFVLGAKQRDGDLSDSDASTSSRQGFVAREKQKWEERQRQERKEKRAKARAKKAEQEKQARE